VGYRVQEIFPTLQGEGAQTGRSAVFLRFSGCNLWDGDPHSRQDAACKFCDTDFVSLSGALAGEYPDAWTLAAAVASQWTGTGGTPLVVCTGGEPLLQLDAPLLAALRARGFEIAVETNGTREAPEGIDWVCVSPKAGTRWVLKTGDELKVVWPQNFDLEALETLPFRHRFLQPKDDQDPDTRSRHRAAAIEACLRRPAWRLSSQTHKALGIP
jgi:7-carboxy-7-deazaguanine synthase (Cx14CxxC type)